MSKEKFALKLTTTAKTATGAKPGTNLDVRLTLPIESIDYLEEYEGSVTIHTKGGAELKVKENTDTILARAKKYGVFNEIRE